MRATYSTRSVSSLFLTGLLLVSLPVPVLAAEPSPAIQAGSRIAPPQDLAVEDKPFDNGRTLIVRWALSPDDTPEDPVTQRVKAYRVERAVAGEDTFVEVRIEPSPVTELEDSKLTRGLSYIYRVSAIGLDGTESNPVMLAEGVSPRIWLHDPRKGWFLVITLFVSFWIIYFIFVAQRGADLKIRKIAGLEAVDEAVGRATEMGRPILFVPGIQDMNNIQTVAGITILSRIGRTAAEYDARIEVPTARSLVMTTARETLQTSYLSAGRPDAYHDDMSYYVTDEQFGYVAYLAGYMVREKPAACFYLGAFFAESLILAETGNSIGAIQVAGTAEPAQLPFFVAACDYTLIGEEFFAASAYLSGEPQQLGTLKGQDMGKILGALLIVIGCLFASIASVTDQDWAHRARHYMIFHVLGAGDPPALVIPPRTMEETGGLGDTAGAREPGGVNDANRGSDDVGAMEGEG